MGALHSRCGTFNGDAWADLAPPFQTASDASPGESRGQIEMVAVSLGDTLDSATALEYLHTSRANEAVAGRSISQPVRVEHRGRPISSTSNRCLCRQAGPLSGFGCRALPQLLMRAISSPFCLMLSSIVWISPH